MASGCRSTAPTKSDAPGPTPTKIDGLTRTSAVIEQLAAVVNEAHTTGFTVQSATARSHAEVVAMAASLQLITTRVNSQVFSRNWQITTKGLMWLNEHKDSL